MGVLLDLSPDPVERARRQFLVDQREQERLDSMTVAEIVRELSEPPAGAAAVGPVDPEQDRREREARLRAKCARQGLPQSIADRLIEKLEI